MKFDSNVFVPSVAPVDAGKQASLQQLSASKLQMFSSAALPSMLEPKKLTKMVLDKICDNLLEWPDWSGQFFATVDESGAADLGYVIGKTKAAIKGMGYIGQIYQVACQTLEHDFGRAELVVTVRLRNIHAYPQQITQLDGNRLVF